MKRKARFPWTTKACDRCGETKLTRRWEGVATLCEDCIAFALKEIDEKSIAIAKQMAAATPPPPTHLRKVAALLTELGVEFKNYCTPKSVGIRCKQGDTKVGGYPGFFTDFEFDTNGNLIQMGAWE